MRIHINNTDASPLKSQSPRVLAARRENLIDAYWAGEIGDPEFAEVAFGLGMEAHEIGQVMTDVREEDGTL